MADWENRLRNAGQQMQDASQGFIKGAVDDPIEAAKRQRQIQAEMAAKQALMQQQMTQRQQIPSQVIPEVQGMEGQNPEHQQMRMQAMLAAAENMKNIKEKEAAMRMKLDSEDADIARDRAAFDPSQYQQVPTQVQQQAMAPAVPTSAPSPNFKMLKQRLTPKPIPVQPSGAIELSDDPEEMQRQIEMAHQGR